MTERDRMHDRFFAFSENKKFLVKMKLDSMLKPRLKTCSTLCFPNFLSVPKETSWRGYATHLCDDPSDDVHMDAFAGSEINVFIFSSRIPLALSATVEEVMDYRTYCETMAGLLQKPIVKLLRNPKVSRNVKWIYQEGVSSSGLCFLPCFNRKSHYVLT